MVLIALRIHKLIARSSKRDQRQVDGSHPPKSLDEVVVVNYHARGEVDIVSGVPTISSILFLP